MLRRISMAIVALCAPVLLFGQQVLDAQQMISVTPVICDELPLPEDAKSALGQKLLQMTTQNGFGSVSGDFLLTANVVTTNKMATATVPAQYIVDFEVSFFVVAVQEQVIICETSLAVQGVNRLEHKAAIAAINRISARNPVLRKFMDESRGKIIDYYTTRVPALVAKARSLADREQYVEALAVLDPIPECLDEYPAIAELKVQVCTQMLDRVAQTAIQRAKAEIVKHNYADAMDALIAVNPASNHAKEAYAMIDQVAAKMSAEERAAKEEALRLAAEQKEASQRDFDNKLALEKVRMSAAKEAATAYAAQAKTDTPSIGSWLFGKLN